LTLLGEGGAATSADLAAELGTDERGTTAAALAAALRRRGFAARGLRVTWAGLRAQRAPLLALVSPGHWVVVERVDLASVRVWDPERPGGPLWEARAAWEARWAVGGVGVVLAPGTTRREAAAGGEE
jgi:ABC-type bacteriocin/lantibiotic exporter with double-glycine peptidase domain